MKLISDKDVDKEINLLLSKLVNIHLDNISIAIGDFKINNLCIVGKGMLPILTAFFLSSFKKFNITLIYTGSKREFLFNNIRSFIYKLDFIESGRDLEKYLDNNDFEIVISAQNQFIFKKESINKHTILNIHFSFLPHFKGMYPIPNCIRVNPKLGGVTLHKVIEKIDEGEIIEQLNINLENLSSVQAYYIICIESLNLISEYFNLKEDLINKNNKNIKNIYETKKYFEKNSINFKNHNFNLFDNKIKCNDIRKIQSLIFPPLNLPKIYFDEINYKSIYDVKIFTQKHSFNYEIFYDKSSIIIFNDKKIYLLLVI